MKGPMPHSEFTRGLSRSANEEMRHGPSSDLCFQICVWLSALSWGPGDGHSDRIGNHLMCQVQHGVGAPVRPRDDQQDNRNKFPIYLVPEVPTSAFYPSRFLECNSVSIPGRVLANEHRKLYGASCTQDTMTCDYLPPRIVRLGRLVSEGGGGKGTSSQSPESGGGNFIPGPFGGGSSTLGDTGVDSMLLRSASSCDSPSDIEAIECVRSLGAKSAPAFRGVHQKQTHSNSDERRFAHC